MKKKKVALVYGITKNYVDILANVLIGLNKNSKKFWDDIIVYHDDVSLEDQELINQIVPCKFIKFSSNNFAKYVPESQMKTYSIAMFFRYECFNLLNDYQKVIWSDVDVLYQKDISDILQYANKSGLALTRTNDYIVENNFYELIPEYDMFTPLYNSGLIVFSDKMKNYQSAAEWCYKNTAQYAKVLRWPDQGIINLLVQEFKIDVEEIDLLKYHCHPSVTKSIKAASIIHAHGTKKFWNNLEYKKKFPEWYENQKIWTKIKNEAESKISLKKPLVSVLMSTYDRYDYLEESVNSILNQTYQNFELIVVLEKCKNQDKIEKILKSFKDSRIVIVKNQAKLGFAASLNVGIESAKGKYIARMDDDDISLPERLYKQVEYLEKNPEVGVCGSKAQFFMKSHDVWDFLPTDSEEIKVRMLSSCPMCHPSVVIRKSVLDKYNIRYSTEYFTEDYELWSRVVKYCPIVNLNEVLIMYRASDTNSTSGDNELKIHTSHKNVMKKQFKEYLNLELTDNELELLQGRKNIYEGMACYESAIKLRNSAIKKILSANKKIGFYNQQLLEKQFPLLPNKKITHKKPSLRFIKKIVKRIILPIYRPIFRGMESRMYGIINNQCQLINVRLDQMNQNIIENNKQIKKMNLQNKKAKRSNNYDNNKNTI